MTTDIEICGNLNCHRTALPGMAYCSEKCAPFGRLGLSQLRQDLERGFTTLEHGEPSLPLLRDERRTKSGAKLVTAKTRPEPRGPTNPIATKKMLTQNDSIEPSKIQNETKNGETGMPRTKTATLKLSTDQEPTETLPLASVSLPSSFRREESDSMSSLRESISTLKSLTISFGETAINTADHTSAMTAIGAAKVLADLVRTRIELTKLERQMNDS